MLRKLLKQKRFKTIEDVQTLATYELQGISACYMHGS